MSISRDAIESELAKRWIVPRSAALVRLHDADEAHYRHARQTTIIAAILFMSLVLIEPFIMRNTLAASLILRLGLSPIILAALLWFFRRRPPLYQVHFGMGLTVVLAAIVWSYIMLSGTYDGPNDYFFTGFLFFPTSNIFMRLKFEMAALSSVLLLLVLGIDALLMPEPSI